MGEFKKDTESSGNSPLELHSADFGIFEASQTPSLASAPKIPKSYESQTENPSVVLNNKNGESTNQTQSCNNSSLRGRIADSHEAIQKNKSCDSATESRPIRGAKNRIQTSSSASADFLLESDKRGSPPKSEKWQLLARRGSGVGGAALLRKENGESNSKRIVGDSQVAKIDCHESAIADSCNDEIGVDCFGDESPRNDESESQKDNAQNPKFRSVIVGASGLSLGISIVVAILLGIGAGILMQKIFGIFWVLFLGVFWGIAAAVLNVYKVYKAELRDFETLANDPKYKNMNPK